MSKEASRMAELGAELEHLLRLRSLPVGVKRVLKRTELEGTTGWKAFDHRPRACQCITMARMMGWAFALTEENVHPCDFPWAMGLGEEPEDGASGMVGTWFKTLDDARTQQAGIPRVPGKIEAILMAPLGRSLFAPDIVWVHASPSQMILLINGIQWSGYERLEFSCTGESSCVDAPHQCYLSGKPAISFPCYSERWFGGAKEEEVSIAIPATMMEKAVQGVRAMHKTGYRYPIPSTSSETDPAPAMAKMYGPGKLEERITTGSSFWD